MASRSASLKWIEATVLRGLVGTQPGTLTAGYAALITLWHSGTGLTYIYHALKTYMVKTKWEEVWHFLRHPCLSAVGKPTGCVGCTSTELSQRKGPFLCIFGFGNGLVHSCYGLICSTLYCNECRTCCRFLCSPARFCSTCEERRIARSNSLTNADVKLLRERKEDFFCGPHAYPRTRSLLFDY